MQISEREKRLLMITAVIAVVGILAIGWGLFSKQSSAPVSEGTAMRLDDLFEKIDNVESQKERNLVYKKRVGNLEGSFVSSNEITPLLAELEQLSGRNGVRIKGYTPNLNNRAQPLARLEIRIACECPFDKLVQFLDAVQKAKYYLQPSTIKASLVDKNRPDLDVQITLFTYLLDQQNAPNAPTTLVTRGEE
ncbi:MAG: type 4a pilus biogenesis protein PilO [bacterium]|jgi:Tfp pilus assembly protein PilO|nr:type 4a pilus biogenesis protein PilO [bacterium]